MPLSAFCLALGAAFMHATWNVLLAGSRDSEASTAVATLCGVVLLAPLALITGGVTDAALPFAAASAALHVAYLALLARAYQDGQVSVVYPVSRGTAPVLVLAFGAVVLGEGATGVQVAGVIAVSAGVFLVGARRADPDGPHDVRRDLLFGGAIALTIAAYTLVDAEGVDRAQAPPTCSCCSRRRPWSTPPCSRRAAADRRCAPSSARGVPDRGPHRWRIRQGARVAPGWPMPRRWPRRVDVVIAALLSASSELKGRRYAASPAPPSSWPAWRRFAYRNGSGPPATSRIGA